MLNVPERVFEEGVTCIIDAGCMLVDIPITQLIYEILLNIRTRYSNRYDKIVYISKDHK